MEKTDLQKYINRWELVREVEEQEIKSAPFDLLLQQTLSIWNIGRSLAFFDHNDQPIYPWSILQTNWMQKHA